MIKCVFYLWNVLGTGQNDLILMHGHTYAHIIYVQKMAGLEFTLLISVILGNNPVFFQYRIK